MPEKVNLHLLKEKNENEFQKLFRIYNPLILYVISPILSQKEDKEECISDIHLKLWNNIDSFDSSKGTINTYITAIARNSALNKLKQNKNNAENQELTEDIPSNELSPEEELIKKEQQEILKKAIMQLEPTARIIFYRKYYYLQKTSQIASELGLTQRSVEGKLYRIKIHLKKILGGEFNEK